MAGLLDTFKEKAWALNNALFPSPPNGMTIWDYAKQRASDPLQPNLSSRMMQQDLVNKGLNLVGMAPVGMVGRAKTQYEIAHDIASKNAEKMLGLPKGNTAMQRAKALGFDTPSYHGSPLPDAANSGHLKTSYPEEAVFLADEPYNANAYARSARYPGTRTAQPNVIPVLTKSKNMDSYDFGGKEKTRGFDAYINSASNSGKDGVVFNDVIDEPGYGGNVRAILDPKNIRSRFAAFDPARLSESDLLAGLAPYLGVSGLLGLGMYGKQDRMATE